jgi:hypothetical protein
MDLQKVPICLWARQLRKLGPYGFHVRDRLVCLSPSLSLGYNHVSLLRMRK